ncbi:MAG: type VI secretion system baseplate subunit TssK [Proteobacteria bacterium]|nr:type VI secretion system baseplate subunit TssK [Pseudomonadota bacterium]MBU1583464.1 type VI secretion system baseplate subunit TssK [Pseudomonadota bacterium]MBU2451944.1 type VI secretion system baseplate subunit TssK [Pseudomonadota bacterium]MBU2628471.1 type VI secretion system baseplate subunit TssK [Pseudomonadota bacterium]
MSENLARVKWEMGQTLLPVHFNAQEEALLADSALRFKMQGLPAYGIAGLKWNHTLLQDGVFSIQSLSMVLPSGLLINVPGNATVSPFNLNVPGDVIVSVYCHIIESDFDEDSMDEAWDTGDGRNVSKKYYTLAISPDQSYAGALETLKLAEFKKNPDSTWLLSRGYIPPMLQVGLSLFLTDQLEELNQALELFHYNLAIDASGYLSGESLLSVKQCMKSSLKMQRFIANIKDQIHCHPYFVLEALNDFYTEVCYYRKVMPENVTSPYKHERLATCFNQVIDPLMKQMQMMEEKSPYLPFEFKDGIFNIDLPSEIREARDIFFLVQKGHITDKIDVGNVKLGNASRIALIHKMALPGVPLKKTEKPPFQHSFGSEVDFFRIIEGEEWDHALRTLSLSFYHQEMFSGIEFFLYWR